MTDITEHPTAEAALFRELIGDEAVLERKIVGVDVPGRVDQIRTDLVAVRYRIRPPPVIALLANPNTLQVTAT